MSVPCETIPVKRPSMLAGRTWWRPRAQSGVRGPTLRRVAIPLIKPETRRIIPMSIAAIVGGFTEAVVLFLIARLALALTSNADTISIELGPAGTVHTSVLSLVVIAGVLAILRMILQLGQNTLASSSEASVVNRIREDMVQCYLSADWPLQASEREGKLQNLLTTHAEHAGFLIGAFTTAIIAGFNLVALLVAALWINAPAALGAAIAALAIGMLLQPLRGSARRHSASFAESNAEFATGLTESASLLQVVRIFQIKDAIEKNLTDLSERAARRQRQTLIVSSSVSVVYQGFAMLLMVVGLGIASAANVSGVASLGAVVLIMLRSLTYAQGVQSGIQTLYQNVPYGEILAAERRRYSASAMRTVGSPVHSISTIVFDEVNYEYDQGHPVLKNISLATREGEAIGIVGPSGSGKSTLVQIILGLREPTSGQIVVDGQDRASLSLADWYRHVSFVPQEPLLFSGTIADNIRFFRPGIADDDIVQAATQAHLHEDISAWPLGFETPVGERGHRLSGGQKQRLCIARALVGDPSIVVLDEPTSALDLASESFIRDTLASLRGHTTLILIAHRMSTLAMCDRIMVLVGGVIQAFDEPSALEESDPFYREALRLAQMQPRS